MKILYVSDPDSPYTRRWLNWFAIHGHTVLLAADNPVRVEWADINIYPFADRFNISILKYLVWSYSLRRLIAQLKPDILHAHRVSSAGWVAAFSNFHPLVVTPWGSDLYLHPDRSLLAKWLAKFVLKKADLITADSMDLCIQAIRFGANPLHTHVIQWGVDLHAFTPGTKSLALIDQLKISTGPIILIPRAVKPLYNLDVIAETIPIIREHFPGVIYLFRDYNTDQGYKISIENLISKLKADKSVRWLERVEPWKKNADVYRLADLVISIASSDGTPGSVLEAFACGIPVIASDLPSLREWIEDGKNGLLVPPREPQALASAILNLLKQPAMMERFRSANLSLVRQRADHEIEMHKMENLYQELI